MIQPCQLSLLTERTPTIKVMNIIEDFERSKHPWLDPDLHCFVVTIFWPNASTPNGEQLYEGRSFYGKPRFNTLVCAARTLVHYSCFGGFITNEKTGKVISIQQAHEILNRYPYES